MMDAGAGVIWCEWCGEIRDMKAPTIEAPEDERIASDVRSDVHPAE